MNIMNHYGCGAEGVRANEHFLIGHAILWENLRQVTHRTNAEGAARAHERFHTWLYNLTRVGMLKLKQDVKKG